MISTVVMDDDISSGECDVTNAQVQLDLIKHLLWVIRIKDEQEPVRFS